VSTLSALIHYNSGILATTARQEKERKEICIEKEEAKVALFKDDMIWYLNVPKNSTKKLLDLINIFNNIAGYKINIINIRKSVVLLHTNKELVRKKSGNQFHSQYLKKI
jgi:hypothetical protein